MEYNFNRLQGEIPFQQLKRISVDKVNGLHRMDWLDVKEKFGFEQSAETLRRYAQAWKMDLDNSLESKEKSSKNEEVINKYRSTTEIMGDGSHKSDRLVEMNDEQSKNPDYVLKAHGFDKSEWELVSAKNSIWNANQTDGTKTLFSSKISVKPKVNGFDVDRFLEKLESIKPKYRKQLTNSTDRLLTLSFVDLHFGINSCEDYQQKLDETIEIIQSKQWDTIYIPLGNDALHNNDHTGKTANGTQIETVDMDYATEEFYKFYTILIEESLDNSTNVVADYIPGNHDADITWMMVKMLAKMYPQIKWNTSMDAKKMFKWKNIFLVNLHGEKGINRVAKTLITEYRDYMVDAKTTEIHSGHLHSEKVKDEFGILVRTLPTSAKTDGWHKNMSFEGANKTSQLFEYDCDKLKVIHYV
ncbi:hypothetical protein [Sporosarcina sp. FSL W7-1283]|uniref:hypothetical protein n=1 Tax=Sporosarcina sp. FSL W7-1283 TaxID=2921560 RepID=UPI0030F6DEA5